MSKKVLDREIRDLYEVPIMAIDAGSLTAYTLLRVSVVDKNDNQPVFRIGEYKANVHSNSTIGTKIIQVFILKQSHEFDSCWLKK